MNQQELELAAPTSALLTKGEIYGLKDGPYVNDPEMILPHDAIRHQVPDGVRVIRATGERTYQLVNYEPETYNGDPVSLTGLMPVDTQDLPERGRRTRPGDRMRHVPDFSAEQRPSRKQVQAESNVPELSI